MTNEDQQQDRPRNEDEKPNPRRCEKCLAEWRRDWPETYENCAYRASRDCPVNEVIARTSFG